QNKQKDPPPVGRIEIDTSMLIDREILAPQEWNIHAEKEFRERWVLALSAHPTILDLYGKYPIEEGFRGPFWNGVALPTTGGLITWDNLLSIPGVITAYWDQVRNSPMARAAREYFAKLQGAYDSAKSEWDSEDDRKSEFPIVSSITEFFSSNIDWKAAEKLLPPGKKFDDMDPWEIMEFLGKVDEAKLERVKAELPSFEKVMKVYEHLLKVDTAVTIGQYEAALVAMPMVADEIEEMYRATTSYGRRVNAAASTIVTTLQYVRAGCNIILTVGGGVMGKAYGLLGVAGGSAAGAGIGTFTQETAFQLASGKFDPGSILFKTGKDAAMTFIGSMIGGALGSKFASLLGPRLATVIPNEAVRQFVIGRVADVSASFLTTPIDITVTGMLEGNWPKSMDDLLDKVAMNAVRDVIIGGAVDVVTGVPNLKGKAWDQLTETDIQGAPKQLGAGDPAAPKRTDAGDPVAAGKQAADTVAAKDTQTQTQTGGQPAGGGARGRVISDGAEVVSIDRSKPIGASGFTGSTADRKGYGVFEARIRLPDGTEVDAVVKILKPNSGNVDADFFAAEVQGAKMAAQSGYGPDFYGTVPMGNDWAFAMGKLEGGGFIQNYGRPGEPGFTQAEAETQAAIDALTPQTGQDVRDYGEALWNLGYHAGGDTQGLVMPDGRWRPIDFSGIEKLPADPVEALKLKAGHDKIINEEAATYDKKLEERNKARGGP
ncbi:MAG TPA: hypothetical protein VG845_14140, partial [Dehalococcoidia bacterium]|nr:hypothetical protein [Dehalococcoidia bacterium]